jgi:hypothetical protein
MINWDLLLNSEEGEADAGIGDDAAEMQRGDL